MDSLSPVHVVWTRAARMLSLIAVLPSGLAFLLPSVSLQSVAPGSPHGTGPARDTQQMGDATPGMGDTLEPTRRAWHGVAELVLAGPQVRATDHLRLHVVPGGFATAYAPALRVELTELVADGR